MNRTFALAVVAAILGAPLLSGCTDGDATSDGASASPTVLVPPTAKAPDTVQIKPAPPVIHPNVMLNIRCTEEGTIATDSVDINGVSGKQSLTLSAKDATPKFDTGWDCYFHLNSRLTSATYVTAIPMRPVKSGKLKMKWFFSEALTPAGLNEVYGTTGTVGLVKGQMCHVYVEVNGLSKPDSFNSATLQNGSLRAQKKDYDRRVDEMNGLMLNKLSRVTYPNHGE